MWPLQQARSDLFSGLDEDDDDDDEDDAVASPDGLVRVFVRKRPLFEYEAARGEFDVVRDR